jgi:hypothetical protein
MNTPERHLRLVPDCHRFDCCWGVVGGCFLVTINLRRARDIAVASSSLEGHPGIVLLSAPLANFVMRQVGLSVSLSF